MDLRSLGGGTGLALKPGDLFAISSLLATGVVTLIWLTVPVVASKRAGSWCAGHPSGWPTPSTSGWENPEANGAAIGRPVRASRSAESKSAR